MDNSELNFSSNDVVKFREKIDNLKEALRELKTYGLNAEKKKKFDRVKQDGLPTNFRGYSHMLKCYNDVLMSSQSLVKFAESRGLSKDDLEKVGDFSFIFEIDIDQITKETDYLIRWFVNLSTDDKLALIRQDDTSISGSTFVEKTNVTPDEIEMAIQKINSIPILTDQLKASISSELNSIQDEMYAEYDNLMKQSNNALFVKILTTWAVFGVVYFLVNKFLWSWMNWFVILGYPYFCFNAYHKLEGIKNKVKYGDSTKIFLASLGGGI